MRLEIEVQSATRGLRVVVEDERTSIGHDSENHIALPGDATVSRLHAMIERFPSAWCVTDLGSSNGTWVNGERIFGARRLANGDEIRVGQTRLMVHLHAPAGASTEVDAPPPDVTAREHDVLVALCRPLLDRDMFTEPASTRQIADDLVITPAAVKQHLANLYAKFDVAPEDDRRRLRLANAALRSGAVGLRDLEAP